MTHEDVMAIVGALDSLECTLFFSVVLLVLIGLLHIEFLKRIADK